VIVASGMPAGMMISWSKQLQIPQQKHHNSTWDGNTSKPYQEESD